MSRASKKRSTSASPKPRVVQPNPTIKTSLASSMRQSSAVENKPDFKVYQSRNAGVLEVNDLSSVGMPTEDSMLYRQIGHNAGRQYRSPVHAGSPPMGGVRELVSEGSQMHNLSAEYTVKDTSFPPYDQHILDTGTDTVFGVFNLSDNPELNEVIRTLEVRFSRLEKRLETNENLVHLHDEMQRLNHQEKRNALLRENNAISEIQSRLGGLERRLEILEGELRSHKIGLDHRIDDFTHNIEKYLEKFISTTTQLGHKFDSLATVKDSEGNFIKEKIGEVEKKLENIAEEVRERLKTLYDTVENVGKLSHQTSTNLEDEKYNVRKLEDDFLKLLSTSKDMSQSTGDVKWLSEEIHLLKSRQKNILHFLNFGSPSNEIMEIHSSQLKDEGYL